MPRTKKPSPSRAAMNQTLSLVKHDILNDKQISLPNSPPIPPITSNNNAFELLTRNLSFSSDFNNDSLNNNEEIQDDSDTYKVPVNNSAVASLAENYNEISINSEGQLSTLQGEQFKSDFVNVDLFPMKNIQ